MVLSNSNSADVVDICKLPTELIAMVIGNGLHNEMQQKLSDHKRRYTPEEDPGFQNVGTFNLIEALRGSKFMMEGYRAFGEVTQYKLSIENNFSLMGKGNVGFIKHVRILCHSIYADNDLNDGDILVLLPSKNQIADLFQQNPSKVGIRFAPNSIYLDIRECCNEAETLVQLLQQISNFIAMRDIAALSELTKFSFTTWRGRCEVCGLHFCHLDKATNHQNYPLRVRNAILSVVRGTLGAYSSGPTQTNEVKPDSWGQTFNIIQETFVWEAANTAGDDAATQLQHLHNVLPANAHRTRATASDPIGVEIEPAIIGQKRARSPDLSDGPSKRLKISKRSPGDEGEKTGTADSFLKPDRLRLKYREHHQPIAACSLGRRQVLKFTAIDKKIAEMAHATLSTYIDTTVIYDQSSYKNQTIVLPTFESLFGPGHFPSPEIRHKPSHLCPEGCKCQDFAPT